MGLLVEMRGYINAIPDAATQRAVKKLTEIVEATVEQLDADMTANKNVFDAHTHAADGAESGAYNTSTPQSDTADKTANTASVFVDNVVA